MRDLNLGSPNKGEQAMQALGNHNNVLIVLSFSFLSLVNLSGLYLLHLLGIPTYLIVCLFFQHHHLLLLNKIMT